MRKTIMLSMHLLKKHMKESCRTDKTVKKKSESTYIIRTKK